jgi:hypothetical protein
MDENITSVAGTVEGIPVSWAAPVRRYRHRIVADAPGRVR